MCLPRGRLADMTYLCIVSSAAVLLCVHEDRRSYNIRLTERLVNAWRQTPTKWYPLPVAVGALLLIAIQYRKRIEKEVHVDENGKEVVKLKGPWTVRLPHETTQLVSDNLSRYMFWEHCHFAIYPVYGDI